MAQAAPGWYPQPDGTQRYWDGAGWTAHVAPGAVSTSGATTPLPVTAQPQTVHSTPAQPPVRYVPAGQTVVPHYQAPLPGGDAVAPKNPALSLIAALFIPGLGSMINGDVGKGVAILIGYGIAWLFTFILIGIPFLFGFWIWGMVDGYQGAQRWNARHGILS